MGLYKQPDFLAGYGGEVTPESRQKAQAHTTWRGWWLAQLETNMAESLGWKWKPWEMVKSILTKWMSWQQHFDMVDLNFTRNIVPDSWMVKPFMFQWGLLQHFFFGWNNTNVLQCMIWLMVSTLFFSVYFGGWWLAGVDKNFFSFDPILEKISHLTSILRRRPQTTSQLIDRAQIYHPCFLLYKACCRWKNTSTFAPRIQDTSHVFRPITEGRKDQRHKGI